LIGCKCLPQSWNTREDEISRVDSAEWARAGMSSNTIESEEARAASPSNGAWWQSLPYNFTHLRQATDFSAVETLGIKASAASDIVLRTIGATLIRSTALRSTLTEQNFRDEKSEFAFYQRAASGADPDVLFRTPPSSVEVESSPIDTVRLSHKKGQVRLLSFDSPFEADSHFKPRFQYRR
jgi:hypothetical protein